MPAERRQWSEDLTDFEVLDSLDTLTGAPGDDPLDRSLATPERWSAAMKFGATAEEQQAGASLDRQLAWEDPDEGLDAADDRPEGVSWDENASDGDLGSVATADGTPLRTGRLVRAYNEGAAYLTWETDTVARDVGIDGGGASAEEAALHVLPDEDSGPG
jgi:Family of unknown function (DUF5709)